jgi:hypothetical protein
MSVTQRFRNAGCDQLCAGEYQHLTQWDTFEEGELKEIVFGMLLQLNLQAYRVNDGNTVYVEVEPET